MKPENKYCTEEQAMKLRSLGVIQDGTAAWLDGVLYSFLDKPDAKFSGFNKSAIAFDVAELLQLAPSCFTINRFSLGFEAWYNDSIPIMESEVYDNPAQAAAELLIRIIEHNLIAVEEVNKRLLAGPKKK